VPLKFLSVVVPARDEEGCIASTVEHLHVGLRLKALPYEIVVVDDRSTDSTWAILREHKTRIPECEPLQNKGSMGSGRQFHLDSTTLPETLS
jgi:dolichol-phosphate mannosyltransferase